MRILLAPQALKGSLTAAQTVRALAQGVRTAIPDAQVIALPIADGGEGFAEVFCDVLGGEWVEAPAHDPLGRSI